MYSAGDSSGDGLSGLNQFAGMSGSIDWAAMAQQWIQMHDTSNFISMPDAPPPPNISNTLNEVKMTTTTTTTAIKKSFDEKGEADMDMDEDEESARCGDTPPSPAPSTQLGKNRDHPVMQPQSPWFMQQPNIVVGPPVAENIPGIGNTTTPIIPSAPQWNATVWPPRINLPPPVPPTMLNVPLNSPMPNPTAHIPSLLKMNVPNPNIVRMISANTGEQNPTQSVVDAKKRKMLPAWIREGLEKMEREKQKQLEREQNKQHEDPEGIDDTKYTEFVGTTDDATHTVNMKYKQSAERENDRSGCEDEGELEDLDGVAITDDTLVLLQNPTPNDDDGSGNSGAEYETDNENSSEQLNYKGKRSYEDRLADLMIVVRTTLTELLLDVTNQEIANLAQEAVNAHKAKASSAQVIRKSALSSITGKLGLAAYDDSTGDESSDSEDGASADNDPNNDSEEELKASIRAKRRAFAKITEDIEESIAASAAREEQKLKYYTSLEKQKDDDKPYKKEITVGDIERNEENSTSTATSSTVSKSYDRDFGETTETKLQNSNGKRQKDRNSRKERTTRFSDNKDSKSAAAVAATYMSKVHGVNANLSGNPNGSTIFPVVSTTNATSVLAAGSTSASSIAMAPESTHIAYNVASKLVDDSNSGSVTALNKNLLNAAEAAYDKVTKGHRASSSRSSASRTERERSHRSRHYDHRDRESDRYRERGSERERKRNREHESTRDKDRDKEHHHHKNKREDHSSDEDDGKEESQTSSSDTDTSSTSSSTSSSSSSQQSSHYSRTSTSSKKRREHEYDRRKNRDERSHRRTRSGRSRSRSRQRSHHHSQRGSSYRHSSAEDDNGRRSHHSSSRHGSSRKHSRSRSRSTYSSSSHWRRH